MSYYTLDFLSRLQRWVILNPLGEVVAAFVTWEAANSKMERLNNEHTLKEES